MLCCNHSNHFFSNTFKFISVTFQLIFIWLYASITCIRKFNCIYTLKEFCSSYWNSIKRNFILKYFDVNRNKLNVENRSFFLTNEYRPFKSNTFLWNQYDSYHYKFEVTNRTVNNGFFLAGTPRYFWLSTGKLEEI